MKIPLKAVGHFNISAHTRPGQLVVDFPNFQDYDAIIDSDMLGPWQYVLITVDGDDAVVTVFDVLHQNKTATVPLTNEIDDMSCGDTCCYGVDVDDNSVVQLDPYTGVVETLFKYPASAFLGFTTFANAFDRTNLIYYQSMSDSNLNPVLVAFDMKKKHYKVLNATELGSHSLLR